MLEGLFEFFFKYRPLLYSEGDLAFIGSWSRGLLFLCAAGAIGVAWWSYRQARGKTTPRDRLILTGVRGAILALFMILLMRPALILQTASPQQNFLAVLIDDSRSLGISEEVGGTPRNEFVLEHFGPEGGELAEALAEKFTLRYFRFSNTTERLHAPSELGWQGTRSDIGGALDRVREELAGVPLAGMVVLSDGADNSDRPISEALVPLQAAGIPVYSVGIGEETVAPDVQLTRVDMPPSILKGSTVVVDVVVTAVGMQGQTVPIFVEEEGKIIATEDVVLGQDGEPVVARVRFAAEGEGIRNFLFRVPPQEGEPVPQNNRRDVMVEVEGRIQKILYFEGEPRHEVAFLRRAVADDENLQVVLLQRTADEKFYRLDVDDAEELAAGFPTTREELFQYRALILGSVEASFFTFDQLQMISDFVATRGGGLVALGGRNSFAEGGFAGTPVEDALPVFLDEGLPGAGEATPLKARPTRSGLLHPITQIASPDAAEAKWDSLPELLSLNPLTRLKPGATSLLMGTTPDGAADHVVLAVQRFGRGRSAVLPMVNLWYWQMAAEVSLEDQTHETLWRQTLRWLVDGVPDPVVATVVEAEIEPGGTATLIAEVSDSAYFQVNDGSVSARITDPLGAITETRLEWTLEQDGVYQAQFPTLDEGIYEVLVEAQRGADLIGSDTILVRAAPSTREYFDAGRRTALLERIADETGGRFYNASDVSSLAEDVQYSGSGVTTREERDLWDMPFFFFLIIGLLSLEWFLRRRRRLV